jgi:hypothetical protein
VKQGTLVESFHAAPDLQATRNLVVQTMVAHENWRFASVVMEKRKINPVIREPDRFYPKFAGMLLKFVLNGFHRQPATDRVIVYADTLPLTRAKREGVLKAMKTTCAGCLPGTVAHHVYSYGRLANNWLQVADYCCWAVAKKWERGDSRTYDQLRPRLASTELVVTDLGDGTIYY